MGDKLPTGNSRPFLQRQEGELGLYISMYDAEALNSTAFGSEQFFRMHVIEKLLDTMRKLDMDKITQTLDNLGVLDGCFIERMEEGIILVLGFDDIESLEGVWKQHENDKLTNLITDVFLTKNVLEAVGAKTISITAKLYKDEYTKCKEELLCRKMARLDIKNMEPDLAILKRIKDKQEKMSHDMHNIRDTEHRMEKNLGDFLMTMKDIIPRDVVILNSLAEFEKFHRETKISKKKSVDEFSNVLKLLRDTYDEIYKDVIIPMLQIHGTCETDTQKTIKRKIRKQCCDGRKMLQPEVELQTIVDKAWQQKCLERERDLYSGLISLIPICCKSILDINHMVDEYLLDFPTEVYK